MQLNLSTSAVSRHVAQLEAQLGAAKSLRTRVLPAREAGRVPHLHLQIDAAVAGSDALVLSRRLQGARPQPENADEHA